MIFAPAVSETRYLCVYICSIHYYHVNIYIYIYIYMCVNVIMHFMSRPQTPLLNFPQEHSVFFGNFPVQSPCACHRMRYTPPGHWNIKQLVGVCYQCRYFSHFQPWTVYFRLFSAICILRGVIKIFLSGLSTMTPLSYMCHRTIILFPRWDVWGWKFIVNIHVDCVCPLKFNRNPHISSIFFVFGTK